MVAELLFRTSVLVVVGRRWSSFDGPVTARTAHRRPRVVLISTSRTHPRAVAASHRASFALPGRACLVQVERPTGRTTWTRQARSGCLRCAMGRGAGPGIPESSGSEGGAPAAGGPVRVVGPEALPAGGSVFDRRPVANRCVGAPARIRRMRLHAGAYGRLMAYDVLVECQRLIASGLPDRPVRLSRRHRFAPVAVDVDGGIAAARFLRRGAGSVHDETHLLTGDGQSWTYRGGGGSYSFGPWSAEDFEHARDEVPADRVQVGSGPAVRVNSPGWLPISSRWLRSTDLLVGRNVASVVVDGRRRLVVPPHGHLIVVWPGRRPPHVSAQDAEQHEFADYALPSD
jgi:hypothetical protein